MVCLPAQRDTVAQGPAAKAALHFWAPHHLPPESGGAVTLAWAEGPCNWPWVGRRARPRACGTAGVSEEVV